MLSQVWITNQHLISNDIITVPERYVIQGDILS